jgi:hypothetical protein
VVFHSIMWMYLPPPTQAAIAATIHAAGMSAHDAAPLAWLRFEQAPDGPGSDLRLTLWPAGEERCLATAHPHGTRIRFTPQSAPPSPPS